MCAGIEEKQKWKYRNGNTEDVCFIDASDYYTAETNQNIITDDDINRIVEAYVKRKPIDRFCYIATRDEIKNEGYNLNIPRYVDTFEEEIDSKANRRELAEIEKKEQEIVARANLLLAQLGL